jgi:hypothetical protein
MRRSSCLPSRRALSPQIHIPSAMTPSTSATRAASGNSSSHHAATTPTMLPNVPGA